MFGLSLEHLPIYPFLAVTAASYLLIVRHNRFQRVRKYERKLGFEGLSQAEIYEKITTQDAETIIAYMSQLEFPKIFTVSLQFALFRTYAIPTISRILKKSKQLAEPQYAGRRYADTSVLLSEFSTWPLDSERSSLALARINYLHSRYPEILPSDTLYTLLLFATQPAEFAARLEWRALTPLELAAQWKYWYEVGQRMGIPADTIPKTFEGMTAWYKKYEEEFMVPDDTNHYVAVQTQTLLLYWVPTELGRWFGSQAVLALLDDRLRIAMKFPLPTWWVPLVVSATFTVRRWFIKHLRLPRIDKDRFLRVNKDRDSKTGRYHLKVYDNEPWYAEQTFANRWGPWGILARLAGKPVAGDKGFREDGYEIETVGPVMFENTGVEKVRQAAEDMRKAHAGGGGTCPFAI